MGRGAQRGGTEAQVPTEERAPRDADALAQKDFWRALCEMQDSGAFGMLGPVHNSFGFARVYPLATLPIDTELLREKWALTHPALVTETEEAERE